VKLVFWFKGDDPIKISCNDNGLIRAAQTSGEADDFLPEDCGALNPYILGVLNQPDIQARLSAGFSLIKNSPLYDLALIFRLKNKLCGFRQEFYTALALCILIYNPQLIPPEKMKNSKVTFVDVDTFSRSAHLPNEGNFYLAYLNNRLADYNLAELLEPLLNNPDLRSDAVKSFIEASLRGNMGDVHEQFLLFDSMSTLHRRIRTAKLLQFATAIRHGLIHNYRFKWSANTLAWMPITWRQYTLDSSLNGQRMSNQNFPLSEYIILIDDIIELIDLNISEFPVLKTTSPHAS